MAGAFHKQGINDKEALLEARHKVNHTISGKNPVSKTDFTNYQAKFKIGNFERNGKKIEKIGKNIEYTRKMPHDNLLSRKP